MKVEVLPGVRLLGVLGMTVAAVRPVVHGVGLGVTAGWLIGWVPVPWWVPAALLLGPVVAAWAILLWAYLGLLWGVGPAQANLFARNVGRVQAKQWRELKAGVRDLKRAIKAVPR